MRSLLRSSSLALVVALTVPAPAHAVAPGASAAGDNTSSTTPATTDGDTPGAAPDRETAEDGTATETGALAARRFPVPNTFYDLPFRCRQSWTGGTRASHSPSRHAVDFNRPQDLGKPVVASAAGTVTVAQRQVRGGYGKYVVIDHGQGESTLYAHLRGVFVRPGARVDKGAMVGAVGATGNVSGAHLHYEQKVGRDVVPAYVRGTRYSGGSSASQNCVDVPVAGNFAGGRADEVAVFRRTAPPRFHVLAPGSDQPLQVRFGAAVDEPLVGDWDGDGRDDAGAWGPRGRRFKLRTSGGVERFQFGARGDRPLVGDWDGDGRSEVGVFRPQLARFLLRSADGTITRVNLGRSSDVPVTGDWDGDGRTDLGVFDPDTAVFTLRTVQDGRAVLATVAFGSPGDLPVVGDWNGNGRTDLGVWDPTTAVFQQRRGPKVTAPPRSVRPIRFGRPR